MGILKRVGVGIVFIVIGALAVIGFQWWQRSNSSGSTGRTEIDLNVLKESMEENYELSTANYIYTSSITVTDQNTLEVFGFEDIDVPFTEALYIVEFDGEIKAGFDLRNADVSPDSDNLVVVTLPQPEVLSHETGDVELVYEKQNIANPLHAGEESSWIEDQKAAMVKRAESLGLYDEARQNAEVVFKSLYEDVLPAGVSLEIRFDEELDEANNGK